MQRMKQKLEKRHQKLLTKMRIQTLGVYTIILLITLVIGGMGSYYFILDGLTESIGLQATLREQIIDSFFEKESLLLERLGAQIENVLDQSENDIRDLLVDYTESNGNTIVYYVGLKDGTLYVGNDWLSERNYNIKETEWYQLGENIKEGIGYTGTYIDAQTGKMVITLVKSIYDKQDNYMGVVATDLYLTDIQHALNEQNMSFEHYNMLVDHKGNLLAHEEEMYKPKAEGIYNFSDVSANYNEMLEETKSNGEILRYKKDYDGKLKLFSMKKLDNGWQMGVVISNEVILKEIGTILLAIILLILMIFIITYLISMDAIKRLVKPITLLASDVAAISDGDLTIYNQIVRNDEMGVLAKNLNHMTETISGLIGKIQEMTQDVHHSVGSINQAASNNQEAMNLITTVITDVARDNTEQGAEFERINGRMKEVIKLFRVLHEDSLNLVDLMINSNELVANGQSTMTTLEGSTSDLNESTVHTVRDIEKFGNKINEIHNITDLINELAHKTRLLSINASIEASRFGESGKGFDVIAKEMSDLAMRTALANEEVGQALGILRDEMLLISEESISMMEHMTKQNQSVQETYHIFEQIKVQLNQIQQGIVGTFELMEKSVTENEAIGETIAQFQDHVTLNSQRLQEISAMTQEQLSNTIQIEEEITILDKECNSLDQQMERFKTK